MPLLELKNISKFFGPDVVLEDLSWRVERGERVGFVGLNGSGKTTLFRLIVGELEADGGAVILSRQTRIGYLPQEPELDSDRTAYEEAVSVFAELEDLERRIAEVEAAMAEAEAARDPAALERRLQRHAQLLQEYEVRGGYDYEVRTKSVLAGLGFDEREMNLPVRHLSGGQKSRLALAQLLLQGCDLLLLDEPTNHLDIPMTEWLENFLRSYPGAVIAVSHDRTFLNHVAQKIIELEDHHLTEYYYGEGDAKLPPGTHQFLTPEEARPEDYGAYSHYLLVKAQQREVQEHTYQTQQREIRRQEAFIRLQRQKATERSARAARSRERLLAKMERVERPSADPPPMRLHFTPQTRGGNDIVQLDRVTKRYGEKLLFEDVNLFVRRLDRVGIVGPNGCGKTTLLRLILGEEEPTFGRVKVGPTLNVGYFKQEDYDLDLDQSPLEEIRAVQPAWRPGEVRDFLARFLFFGDDVFRPIHQLSGGERSRLVLAKLLLQGPNFLVLDEPTNPLDIAARMVLEEALLSFEGTILVVSHDRYFLDRVCRRLLVFEGPRTRVIDGGYSDYKALLRREEEEAARREIENRKSKIENRKSRPPAPDLQPRGPSLEEIEARIGMLEDQLAVLDQLLAQPTLYTNAERVQRTLTERQRVQKEVDEWYELWGNWAEM